MPEKHPSASPAILLRERPRRLEDRTRPRVIVQVVDGKICCELTPAERPAPRPKP